MTLRQKLVAEFLGTFALVFAGTGAIIINDVTGGVISHVGVALTFGLVVLGMIYTFGEISGAHFNPAVSIAFWRAGRFAGKMVPGYIAAQVAGALTASALLKMMFPTHGTLGSTVPSGPAWTSFILEFVLTFLLMLTILNVSTGSKEKGVTAGIVVGAVICLEAMFAGPISGASMNPARSMGPGLLSGKVEHLWIYIVAPTLGALLAIVACRLVQCGDCCRRPTHPNYEKTNSPDPLYR